MDAQEIQKNINTMTAGDRELESAYGYLASLTGTNTKTTLEKLTLLATLKEMMKTDVVSFTFKKISGEIRQAFGTRANDVLSKNGSTPRGRRAASSSTFPYFDIEKGDWRCFKLESLIDINTGYTI